MRAWLQTHGCTLIAMEGIVPEYLFFEELELTIQRL
jgi:hypothetical protein